MFRGELADRRILFHLIKSASASGARGEGKRTTGSSVHRSRSRRRHSSPGARQRRCSAGRVLRPARSHPRRHRTLRAAPTGSRDTSCGAGTDGSRTDPGTDPGHRRERRQWQPVASNGASLGYGTPTSSADEGRVPCVLRGPGLRQSRRPANPGSGDEAETGRTPSDPCTRHARSSGRKVRPLT